MGSYNVQKNTSISIKLADDYRDNGWTVANNIATHSGCNQGLIRLIGRDYVVGVPNIFKYVVSGYSSGAVAIKVGSQLGTYYSANGTYTETITPLANDEVSFWSNGNLSVEILEIYTDTTATTNTTVAFDEKSNKWVGYYSYTPEMMARFGSRFFMFKDGQTWENHTKETRNNFFGEQFTSKVTFYCNIDPTEIKEFFTMRQKSNKVWAVTEAYIEPQDGKSVGQRTRIKKGNFKNLQGDWFATFLRNMDDPRFVTELDALLNGGAMQGGVLRVTIENTDDVEVRLVSVDIEVAPHNYTY